MKEVLPGLSFDGYLIDSNAPKIDADSLDFGIVGNFYPTNTTEVELSPSVILPTKAESKEPVF